MDRKLPTTAEIEQLIRLGDRSRAHLEDEAARLKQRLDVPARLKGSLKEHPTGWLMGSLASGLAVSLLFRRGSVPSSPKKRRSLPVALLGLTLTAVRPLAKVWLADQLKNYLAGGGLNPVPRRNPPVGPHP